MQIFYFVGKSYSIRYGIMNTFESLTKLEAKKNTMKSFTCPKSSVRFSVFTLLLLIALTPFSSHAASTNPSCELHVTTRNGTITVKKAEDVFLAQGDAMRITWNSTSAETATMGNGRVIPLSGAATKTPKTTATYSYRFSSGNARATCAVTAHVITGDISDSSLTTKTSKPTLSGTAVGTKNVHIRIYKEGNERVMYTSRAIRVTNGEWKTKISKKLADGAYTVVLLGDKNLELGTIARETLIVGKSTQNSATKKSDTTLVVIPVPLLMGGTARGGSSVSISYLQIINIGKESTTLSGFSVKQTGTAKTESITGFTVSDDSNTFRGTTKAGNIFNNGLAFVPIQVPFTPGQTRLFTIKAILKNDVMPYVGTQLKIDVAGVSATALLQSTFPIQGTTWTIGL